MSRRLNNRETAIILASLRMAQQDRLIQINRMPHLKSFPKQVTEQEIDTLCKDLNCGTWELVDK